MGSVMPAGQLLNASQQEHFNRTPDVAYICDSDLRLLACNPAWELFALANRGTEILFQWVPGTSIADAMSGPAREYYCKRYRQALDTGEVFKEEYECSSPQRYRRFLQVAYPLGQGRALLITNSLVEEYSVEGTDAGAERYLDDRGVIVQCSHCKRVASPEEEGAWGWVPSLAGGSDPRVSHTFCPWCLEHYHPQHP